MDTFNFTNLHFISFVIAILLGLFKDEVKHTTTSIVHFFTRQFDIGDRIQVEGADGAWHDIEILDYKIHIPIVKSNGGVEIYHLDPDRRYAERLDFSAWRALRKRVSINYPQEESA